MRKTIWFLLAFVLAGFGGAGCDNDIDPDTLVRELRVLAMRFGDATPGSVAELQATIDISSGTPDLVFTAPSITMSVLSGAPTGPGRRITTPGPRPRAYDWFICTGPLSLFSPGTLDSACLKFAPGDPPPRQVPALVPIVGEGMAPSDGTLTVQAAALKPILTQFLQVALQSGTSGTGTGTGTGGTMLPTKPFALLLPILVEVKVPPPDGEANNPLDREVGYNFLRIVIALPGMTLPPPNHNPTLGGQGGLWGSSMSIDDTPNPMLTPLVSCPEAGPCTRFPVSRDMPVYFTGRADPSSVETYTPLDDSGRENIPETMRYTWFTSDGSFGDDRTGDAHPQTEWQNNDTRPAPPETQVVDLWLILQDDRTGCDYQHFQLSFP